MIIDILITAVRNGELDEQLAQTKKPATVLKYLKTIVTLRSCQAGVRNEIDAYITGNPKTHLEDRRRRMSAIEKRGAQGALDRCRLLANQIESDQRER